MNKVTDEKNSSQFVTQKKIKEYGFGFVYIDDLNS